MKHLPAMVPPPLDGAENKTGFFMFRMLTLGLGGLFVALGVVWFFTPLLDGTAVSLAGPSIAKSVTPISKMALSDPMSQLLGGLTVTGVVLLLLGTLGFSRASTKVTQTSA